MWFIFSFVFNVIPFYIYALLCKAPWAALLMNCALQIKFALPCISMHFLNKVGQTKERYIFQIVEAPVNKIHAVIIRIG